MRITTLCIPTKNRPAMLARCVESYAANAERFRAEVPLDLRVLDDTDGLGAVQARIVIDALAEAVGERDLLEYALQGPSIGAARNVIQLLNVGRWYATADDDTVARLGGSSRHAPLHLSLEHDPTEVVEYASRGKAREVVHRSEPLDDDGEVDFGGVDVLAPLEALLAAGAWVSQVGQVGDCAMGRPSFLALGSREIFRHVRDWTLCRGAHFMAVLSAYDGTRDLPPFYPVGRGEDAVFGQLLAARGALIGHAPYAVLHDPDEPRTLDDEPERPSDTWFEDERFMALLDLWPRVREAAAGIVW